MLESLTIFSKLFDTFVKLIESNLVLKEIPTKFGFVVNESGLRDWLGSSGDYL